jgi:hypothetical protein
MGCPMSLSLAFISGFIELQDFQGHKHSVSVSNSVAVSQSAHLVHAPIVCDGHFSKPFL